MEKLMTTRPSDFVNVADFIPQVETDVRYFSGNNPAGCRLEGYSAPIVYLTRATARALTKAQTMLMTKGYGLRIFDGYRPYRAVEHLMRWKETAVDSRHQKEGFRQRLYQNCQSHMRGSAVDLTVVDLFSGRELDMGGSYQTLDERADARYRDLTPEQGRNRTMLKYLMLSCGFEPAGEWWHYVLSDEPYPDTCFDFEIC